MAYHSADRLQLQSFGLGTHSRRALPHVDEGTINCHNELPQQFAQLHANLLM